MLTDKLIKFR